MPRPRNASPQTRAVLTVLLLRPAEWQYGFTLAKRTGLRSGTLYPILGRLADSGLLESAREQDPPHAYLVNDGHRTSLAVPGLTQRLDPHEEKTLRVTAPLPQPGAQLLITEGGFPTVLTIGDENSPLHAKTVWVP